MLCGILQVPEERGEEMKDSGVGTANETGVLTHTQVPQKPSVSISKVKNSSVGLLEHVKNHKTKAMSTWHIADRCEPALPAL